MARSNVRVSKFLSLVLRHEPELIGLSLDRGGWVRLDVLIKGANRIGVRLDDAMLRQVVEQSDKKRFSISSDRQRIRANYGHSVPVDLDLEPSAPPKVLFHGTASRFLRSIRTGGLTPGNRMYVHLSRDEETALSVGRRHGRPVVLRIQAQRMHDDGFEFYLSTSGVWLTYAVPAKYIGLPK